MTFETLIIDDDPIFVMIAKRIIVSAGFHTSPKTFSNGELAFHFLQEEKDPEAKYAIFLDLNMPVMNGWEFLDQIHLDSLDGKAFVFLMTSSSSSLDKAKAKDYSKVLHYFEKPLTEEDVKSLFIREDLQELIS